MLAPKIPGRKKILDHFDGCDPVMSEVIRKYGPFRLSKNGNYFIVLCRAIIAQQISTKAADSIFRKFNGLFNQLSPTPERVLSLTDLSLRSAGLSGQKVAYLKDLSQKFQDKSIQPRKLPHLSNEEVSQNLTNVYGIGPWTAEMFLIFSLNRLDVLPVGDLGFRSGIKKIYGFRSMPSIKKIRTFGKKWSPFQTIAVWYAWRTIDEEIIVY
ncbi:MAG: DNA-3-methyladenine glycosylase family protein [Nitrospinales bacterium]